MLRFALAIRQNFFCILCDEQTRLLFFFVNAANVYYIYDPPVHGPDFFNLKEHSICVKFTNFGA